LIRIKPDFLVIPWLAGKYHGRIPLFVGGVDGAYLELPCELALLLGAHG